MSAEAQVEPAVATAADRGRRESWGAAGGWIIVSAAAGFVVGLLWSALAPRVEFRVSGGELVRVLPQPEGYFVADLVLGGLLALAGLLLALWWAVRVRRRPMGSLVGLLLGGVAAGFVAVLVGQLITATELTANGLADGVVRSGLTMHSWAMLVWWPTLVATVFAITGIGMAEPAAEGDSESVSAAPGDGGEARLGDAQ